MLHLLHDQYMQRHFGKICLCPYLDTMSKKSYTKALYYTKSILWKAPKSFVSPIFPHTLRLIEFN